MRFLHFYTSLPRSRENRPQISYRSAAPALRNLRSRRIGLRCHATPFLERSYWPYVIRMARYGVESLLSILAIEEGGVEGLASRIVLYGSKNPFRILN